MSSVPDEKQACKQHRTNVHSCITRRSRISRIIYLEGPSTQKYGAAGHKYYRCNGIWDLRPDELRLVIWELGPSRLGTAPPSVTVDNNYSMEIYIALNRTPNID